MIRAVYKDSSDQRYSGEILNNTDGNWTLSTGRALDYYIEAIDAEGGYMEFLGFDVPDPSHAHKVDGGLMIEGTFVPWPVKPNADLRLPNESPYQQLQRVAASRDADSRRMRERERQKMQTANSSARIQQLSNAARRFRNQYAAKKS